MTTEKNDKIRAQSVPADANAIEARARTTKSADIVGVDGTPAVEPGKWVEEALLIFKESLENSFDAIGMTTPDGRHYYQNRAFTELFGTVGDDPSSVYVDKKTADEVFQTIMPGGRWSGELKMYNKERQVRDILLRAYANKDDNGIITALVGIHTDITDIKQANEKLLIKECIVRSSSSAIAACDLEGMMIDANPFFKKLWGFDDSVEFLGKPFRDFWLVDGIYVKIMEALQVYGTWIGELKARRKDGTLFDVQVSAATVYDAKGSPLALTSTSIDITERKRVEKEIRRLNQTLEQQVAERTAIAEARARQLQVLSVEMVEAEERERQRIAQILHDDLQQILVGARFQAQSALRRANPDAVLANIDRLLEEAIATSRSLSHQLSPPVLHQFGLAAALEWLTRENDKQFGLKVHLETDAQEVEDSSLKVFIFRAVQELLFNIVKHSGVKSANVILAAVDKNIVLTISDPGCGFEPEIMNSPLKKGGWGLVSLRERVRAIGGNLLIDSAPGRGCRFTLTVPRRLSEITLTEAARPEPDEPQHKVFESSVAVFDPDDIRVLFADDHQVLRQGLVGLVKGQPDIVVVGEAADGEEALALTRQLNPSLVVMDISMPKMDGIEATRRIKTEMPAVRVIGLSMFDDENVARKMSEAGAAAFVSKSESSTELLKTIYKVAGKGPDFARTEV